jgi:hypothetical protein
MTASPTWLCIANFGAGYEADLAESMLHTHEIPVLRKGPEVGIFGHGFAGTTAHGVQLFVPAEHAEEALALLSSASG